MADGINFGCKSFISYCFGRHYAVDHCHAIADALPLYAIADSHKIQSDMIELLIISRADKTNSPAKKESSRGFYPTYTKDLEATKMIGLDRMKYCRKLERSADHSGCI